MRCDEASSVDAEAATAGLSEDATRDDEDRRDHEPDPSATGIRDRSRSGSTRATSAAGPTRAGTARPGTARATGTAATRTAGATATDSAGADRRCDAVAVQRQRAVARKCTTREDIGAGGHRDARERHEIALEVRGGAERRRAADLPVHGACLRPVGKQDDRITRGGQRA